MSIVDDIARAYLQAGTVPPDDLFDPAEYRDCLADMELSEAQANELLGLLWSMMRSMVELGFSYDLCGQIFGTDANAPALLPDDVDSFPMEER